MVNVHGSPVEKEMEALELRTALERGLNQLSESKHWKAKRLWLILRHRILAEVFRVEKMTLKEIGEQVGVTGNKIRIDEEILRLRLRRWLMKAERVGYREGFLQTIGAVVKESPRDKVLAKLAKLPSAMFVPRAFIKETGGVAWGETFVAGLCRQGLLERKSVKEVKPEEIFGKISLSVCYVYRISQKGREKAAACA